MSSVQINRINYDIPCTATTPETSQIVDETTSQTFEESESRAIQNKNTV